MVKNFIFLAINSGLFSTAWPLVAKSKDDILDISGNLYLPIEATAIKGNFWEAIRKGMDEILNNKKKLEILNPRVAWAKYPSLLDETNEKINFEKGSNEPDWKDHYKYLTRSLSNDYYSQTRFYATQGDLKSAEKLLQKIKNPKKQSLARANIEFLKGSLSKAFKLYKNTSGEKATMNAFLAANALGEIKEAKEILPKIKSKKILKHFGLAAEKVKQGRGSKLTKGPELVKQKLL